MAGVKTPSTVFVSVGSNLGDKLANCTAGIEAISASGHSKLRSVSRFFTTSPVDYTDQDWFVNAAVAIHTTLSPTELLSELKIIEQKMGRKADTIRFGPRVLDLDILLYDQQVIETPNLTIPHPRMHKRAFVLQPMCDINPAIIHPVLGKPAADLLNSLDDDKQKVIPVDNAPAWPKGETH